MTIPVIGSPMFIISNPDLVIAQCAAGIVGAFPALNARPESELRVWLERITSTLADLRGCYPERKIAPFAVNQIVHRTNDRLERDIALCVEYRVPIVITSLRAPNEVVPAIHEYGGVVFHDAINVRHARKALEAGVDGLILVCAGAGGHAGGLSPFAFVSEIREFFDGPIVLAGGMARGNHILAAQAMGADLVYMGTRFIATHEANASEQYKNMIVASAASDIIYTDYFSGVSGNYLRASISAAGLDPDNLPKAGKTAMRFGSDGSTRATLWRDIWGAGQGVGSIDRIGSTAAVVAELCREYEQAKAGVDG